MLGGFKGRKPLPALAVYSASAAFCRCIARFAAKAKQQGKAKAGADVLLRWQEAAWRQEQRAQRLLSALLLRSPSAGGMGAVKITRNSPAAIIPLFFFVFFVNSSYLMSLISF